MQNSVPLTPLSLPSPDNAAASNTENFASSVSVANGPAATVAYKRHDLYYIEDANMIFLVQDTLFKVHRHFLKRDPDSVFHAMLSLPLQTEGMSDESPIVLEQYSSDDFTNLLWIFYNDTYDFTPSSAPAEKWISILASSHRWEMHSIRALALRSLNELSIDPFRKINTWWSYNRENKAWVSSALRSVCTRSQPVTVQETEVLGGGDKIDAKDVIRMLVGIAEIRESVRCGVAYSSNLEGTFFAKL